MTRTMVSACLALGLLFTGAARAQEAPPAAPSDVATEDALIGALYDVISGPPGPRNWDRFRSLFAPGARLIPIGGDSASGYRAIVMTPDEYATRAAGYFDTTGFYEREASHVREEFGQLVHRFSTYESRHDRDQAPFARGINSIQLLNDGRRWWVVSIMWQAEGRGRSLPSRYLPR